MNINPQIENMLQGIGPGRDRVSTAVRVVDGFSWRSYYSGSDVSFEFDGIPIEEIAGISYKVVEPVKFHYGYNSYTALHSSRGARMAHGTLLMNFTDPTTLYFLLNKIREGNTPEKILKKGVPPQLKEDTLLTSSQLASSIANKTYTTEEAQKILNTSWNGNPKAFSAFSNLPDKALLIRHRDSVWGVDPKARKDNPFRIDPVKSPRYSSHPTGFSIKMIFGEPGALNALVLGNEAQPDRDARRQVGAVRELKGVQIISEGLEITETGEPTRVLYEFVATDIN